eukprot:707101-Rhodomonas_salina.1
MIWSTSCGAMNPLGATRPRNQTQESKISGTTEPRLRGLAFAFAVQGGKGPGSRVWGRLGSRV